MAFSGQNKILNKNPEAGQHPATGHWFILGYSLVLVIYLAIVLLFHYSAALLMFHYSVVFWLFCLRTFSVNNRQTSGQTFSICYVRVLLFFHVQTWDNNNNTNAKTRFTENFVKKKSHNKRKFMKGSLKLIGTILQHY